MNLRQNEVRLFAILMLVSLMGWPEPTQNPVPLRRQQSALRTQSDNVYVDIRADYGAQLLLVDEQGRKTGYDSSTAQTLTGIPGAVYSSDSISDVTDDSPQPAESQSRVLEIHSAAVGRYLLKVKPTDQSSYTIEFSCTDIDGPSAHISARDLEIARGEEHSFNLMISPGCSETLVSGVFEESGSGLLSYGYPIASHVHLTSRSFRLVIVYGGHIIPSTFAATVDGNSVADLFHPQRDNIEAVTMPIKVGRHVVQISVSGMSGNGEQVSASDSFVLESD